MNLDALAEQLKSGTISLSEWTASMRAVIVEELTAAMVLAKGGRDNVAPTDWGFLGSQAKEQYAKLDGFAADIAANPTKWLNGRSLNARMDLYGQLGYAALEEDRVREFKKAGFTQKRSVLDPSVTNHCEECLAQAKRGWMDIDDDGWIEIGQRTCVTNDRCGWEYRKPDGAGGWIYGDGNE